MLAGYMTCGDTIQRTCAVVNDSLPSALALLRFPVRVAVLVNYVKVEFRWK